MVWASADFQRIAALDARYGFLEDPEISLPIDAARGTDGSLGLVGVKANIRVAGQAWTAGIRARRNEVASEDADIVATLRAAGADILSRLNMDEAALGGSSWNPAYRKTDNPAAPGYTAGGSSGGSAAAVAAGVCDIALGSDTLGSVRIPAAYCGVFGLKATHGSLSMAGVFPLAPSLDALGFLASGTDALRRALEVCGLGQGAEIERVVVPGDVDMSTLQPMMVEALAKAEETLGALGIPLERAALGVDLAQVRADAFVLTEIEAAEALAGQAGLSDGVQKMLDFGARVPAEKRAGIARRLSVASKAVRQTLSEGTCLLLPTVAESGFAAGGRAPIGQADFTAIANAAGLPALAMPMPSTGLPASVQLVGPPASEGALLSLADQMCRATRTV